MYVDSASDAVCLYLVAKASCWHVGVLLAAPTVKHGGVKARQACVAYSKFK
jgi:hypothetical protein